MGAALTAKTFISILSQSNEKVTAKERERERELELEYDKKEIKPKETIRNECYRQSIFTQAAFKYTQDEATDWTLMMMITPMPMMMTMTLTMTMILLVTYKATLMTGSPKKKRKETHF